jgi:tetratricopeptide (TPR) repeat protein
MLESVTSGRDSGVSEQLKLQIPPRLPRYFVVAALAITFCAQGSVRAQTAADSVSAYADAIRQSTIAERIVGMERYLQSSSGSRLKVDALEFLVWDHMRLGHQSKSEQRAKELLAISPGNPIAVAVLNQYPPANRSKSAVESELAALKSARSGLDHLSKPEGMLDGNFHMLRQQAATMLTGATGLCYLAMQDYPQARVALQDAVTGDPNNSQLVYGLGLALLNGKNRDPYRGYWYLARAANLTGGTEQGKEIVNYAWRSYYKDGGREAGWQRYIASAAALDAPPNPESNTPAPSSGAAPATATASTAASTKSVAENSAGANIKAANPAITSSKSSVDKVEKTASLASPAPSRSKTTKASIGFEDTLREPVSTDVPPANVTKRPRALAAPTEAVSLGILIETSLLTSQNREAIIATLKDIVRNLRSNDEACILVFSDQLDFEQDLTGNDQLLEDAISQIRPRNAKALLSGIAFAAGHLKRIGKNSNRVLLVISDGRTSQDSADTLMFRSQVSGVRINCIGLKAEGVMERSLLERVASYSGGAAAFASDSSQFRTAALQITRGLGIAVQ